MAKTSLIIAIVAFVLAAAQGECILLFFQCKLTNIMIHKGGGPMLSFRFEVHTGDGSWTAHDVKFHVIISDGRDFVDMHHPEFKKVVPNTKYEGWGISSISIWDHKSTSLLIENTNQEVLTIDKVVIDPRYLIPESLRKEKTSTWCFYNQPLAQGQTAILEKCQ